MESILSRSPPSGKVRYPLVTDNPYLWGRAVELGCECVDVVGGYLPTDTGNQDPLPHESLVKGDTHIDHALAVLAGFAHLIACGDQPCTHFIG